MIIMVCFPFSFSCAGAQHTQTHGHRRQWAPRSENITPTRSPTTQLTHDPPSAPLPTSAVIIQLPETSRHDEHMPRTSATPRGDDAPTLPCPPAPQVHPLCPPPPCPTTTKSRPTSRRRSVVWRSSARRRPSVRPKRRLPPLPLPRPPRRLRKRCRGTTHPRRRHNPPATPAQSTRDAGTIHPRRTRTHARGDCSFHY